MLKCRTVKVPAFFLAGNSKIVSVLPLYAIMKNPDNAFIAFNPIFKHPLPEGHRFPMLKYELLPEQLLLEGVITEKDIFSPEPVDTKFLEGVHDNGYVEKLLSLQLDSKEIRRIGFPLSHQLIERELSIAEGTIQSALAAMSRGIGFNIAGGTHHAGAAWGEGFCLLNDQAIAANYLIKHQKFNQILIIDLDVHQGNGTADIFKNENKVFTFSMHGQNNFPFKKEKSDLDVGLPDGINGKDYLRILEKQLSALFINIQPEFIFYQSGVDVLESDKMGKLKLTIDDCRQRDILVFEHCKKFGIPVQVSMGGGYSRRIQDIVNAHCHTYKEGIGRLLHT